MYGLSKLNQINKSCSREKKRMLLFLRHCQSRGKSLVSNVVRRILIATRPVDLLGHPTYSPELTPSDFFSAPALITLHGTKDFWHSQCSWYRTTKQPLKKYTNTIQTYNMHIYNLQLAYFSFHNYKNQPCKKSLLNTRRKP